MKLAIRRRGIALVAATALLATTTLVAPATSAQAVSTATLTGASSVVASNQTLTYYATIGGGADSWQARVVPVSTRTSHPNPPGPLLSFGTVRRDTPFPLNLTFPISTTPGHYRLVLDALEFGTVTSRAVKDLYVYANTSRSRGLSGLGWPKQRIGKKYRTAFIVRTPAYQAGAVATVYYRASGKKSFVKVASGKVSSRGTLVLRTAKGKIRKKGVVYLKVSAVSFCPAYTLAAKAFR